MIRLLFVSCVVTVACLWSAAVAWAQTPTPSPTAGSVASASPAEDWVRDEIAAGRVADLSARFPSESDRQVSAAFLERLLTGPAPHRGVRIAAAVIAEPVDLRNVVVEHETWCIACRFDSPVDFSESRFRNGLELTASRFVTATFQAMEVNGSLGLRRAQFDGPVSLNQVNLERSLTLDEARLGPTHLSGAQVGGLVSMVGTQFDGSVDFLSARINGDLLAVGAKFNSADVSLALSATKVAGAIVFRQAEFAGSVDFGYLESGLDLELIDAHFRGLATCSTLSVGGYMSISRAVFDGPAYFVSSDVGHDLYADQVRFTDVAGMADFSGMRVGGTVMFTSAVFDGGAGFGSVRVGGDFAAYDTHFNSPDLVATFRAAQIDGQLMLTGAVFAGPVEFIRTSASLGFQAEGARFLNPNERVDFSDMQVDSFAFIVGAVFSGTTTFGEAQIKGDLFADDIAFVAPDATASFLGMDVGGSAYLRNAVFQGPVLLARAQVAGQLVLDGAQFLNSDRPIQMNGMRIGESFYLRGATFGSPLDVSDASFLDLTLGGRDGMPASVPYVDLARSVIGRDLTLQDLTVGHLFAPALRVTGPATFSALTVTDSADFQQSNFASLTLANATWPTDGRSLRLDGMSYGHLSAGTDEGSWVKLLSWINGAAYSANVYTTLRSFFSELGYPEQADEVYVAQKRRERAEVLGGAWRVDWWWNWFLDVFVRFGRSPGRAVAWSALIIVAGCLVFPRRYMKPTDPDYGSLPYNAFWHSMDLFVPVLDLGSASKWTPRDECWFARHYGRVHSILGWLLVPIALAALTGIIR